MSQYFPKSNSLYEDIKIKSDLFNYSIKCDVRKATAVDYNGICKKDGFIYFKSDDQNFVRAKLQIVPFSLNNVNLN